MEKSMLFQSLIIITCDKYLACKGNKTIPYPVPYNNLVMFYSLHARPIFWVLCCSLFICPTSHINFPDSWWFHAGWGRESNHWGPLRWKGTRRALCSTPLYLPAFCQHPLQLYFYNLQVFLSIFPDKGLKESCAVFLITPANSLIHQPANWPLTSASHTTDWGNGWREGHYLHTLCRQ